MKAARRHFKSLFETPEVDPFYDRRYWIFDPTTGEKVSSARHRWYVIDSFCTRHLPQLVIFDIVAVIAIVAFVTGVAIHPSMTFADSPKMNAAGPTLPAGAQDSYYRDHLESEAEETFYYDVTSAIRSLQHGVDAPKGMSRERAGDVARMVTMDHPELFWVGHIVACGFDGASGVQISYTVEDPYEIGTLSAKYEQMAVEAISSFDDGYDPEDGRSAAMAAHLYEWVCEHAEYVPDDGSGYDQTIMGVFEGDGCVCAGYARAYKYLCDRAGVACWYVLGSTNEERDANHAWNVVSFGDAGSRLVDATWGDESESIWKWYTTNRSMFDIQHMNPSVDMDEVYVERNDFEFAKTIKEQTKENLLVTIELAA